jgi:predicted Zn-dependent protease
LSADVRSYAAEACHPSLGDQAVPGRVVPGQFTLRFESEAVTLEIPFSHLLIPTEENDLAERVIFRDARDPGLSITTADCEILEHRAFSSISLLRARVEAISGRKVRHSALFATVAFFAIALALGISMSWVAHNLVIFAVNRVSPETEKSIGDKYYRETLKYVRVTQDPAMIARLNSLFDQLRPGLPDSNIVVQFHVIETDVPNAASLPGHIFVTRGLFNILSTPDELEGVLAHEVAHITQKHILRLLVSNKGPAAVIHAVFSDSSSTIGTIAQSSQFVLGRSFSREYEREADAMGWKYLIAANINPRGMIDAFVKFRDVEGNYASKVDFLSTHPGIDSRIHRLEAWWNKLDKKTDYVDLNLKMQ